MNPEISFLITLDGFRKLKNDLEDWRLELLATLPREVGVDDSLFASLYWDYSDIFTSREVATSLNLRLKDFRSRAGKKRATATCSSCDEEYVAHFQSLSNLKSAVSGGNLCFDCQDARKEEMARQSAEWARAKEHRGNRIHELATMPYRDYLLTPEWKDTRLAVLKRAKYRCMLCHQSRPLQVHHRTYERRGHEHLSDLIALCGDCHAKFHGKLPAAEAV